MGEARVEKRNRPPKSCEPCRIRKLKCNRALPCDTCVKRGKDSICQYAANADRNEKREVKTKSVNERLKSVEDLISSLARNGTSSAFQTVNPPQEDTSMTDDAELIFASHPSVNTVKTTDNKLLGGDKATYLDSSHWTSLLEDIREIREQLSPSNFDEQSSTVHSVSAGAEWTPKEVVGDEIDLVFGQNEGLDFQEILQSMPSRQVCDMLVSQYFRPRDAILRKTFYENCAIGGLRADQRTLAILHPTKFQQEYQSFWAAPTLTSPTWVALLFAILDLTASLYETTSKDKNADNRIPPAKLFARRMEQCLVLGNYARAEEHCIEALLTHMQSCFLRSRDSDVNLWLLMGVIIRLAIRLGYHRDPAKIPKSKISPFDGEMRRRVWVSIFQVDTLMSFQMGFPSMIPSTYCDAELPRNLEDHDFSPASTALPESRPLSDITPVLYTIGKAAIVELFRNVVDHTRSLEPSPYKVTLALDARLRDSYEKLPLSLKYKPLNQSIIDSPGMIMRRTTIEILHLKSIIVLHRQYITSYRPNSTYNLSRRACLDSASTVLSRQAELHKATQPGSHMYDDRWMVSALTANDFILAAMIICLELAIRTKEADTSGINGTSIFERYDADFEAYLSAIQVAHQIWATASASSVEARMAAHALGSTIERVQIHRDMLSTSQTINTIDPGTFQQSTMSQAGLPPSLDQDLGLMDGMEYIDWSVLDNQFQIPAGADIALDSWIIDTVGPWGPSQPF